MPIREGLPIGNVNMQTHAFLPSRLKPLDGKSLGVTAREYARSAIERSLEPKEVAPGDQIRIPIYVSEDEAKRIERIGRLQKMRLPHAIGALVEAYLQFEATRNRNGRQSTMPVNGEREKLQSKMFEGVTTGIAGGRIVLAEGGTGLGKSHVIARVAQHHIAENSEGRVGIFAPTLAILNQLLKAYRSELADRNDPLPRHSSIAVVLGRQQFVDEAKLRLTAEILMGRSEEEAAIASAALRWLEDGGPLLTEASMALAREHRELAYLVDDLAEAAPGFPVETCVLDSKQDNRASEIYEGLRARAQDASVVFTSTTMMCLDSYLRRLDRSPILPDFTLGLFDEGHQLEDQISTIESTEMSLMELSYRLRVLHRSPWAGEHRARTLAESALDASKQLEATCRQFPEVETVHSRSGENDELWKEAREYAEALADRLKQLTKRLAKTNHEFLHPFQHAADTCARFASGKEMCWISFSPVRRYARLITGPVILRRSFEHLWGLLPAAALFSGTLLLPSSTGAMSGRYMRMKLWIPDDRVHFCEPCTPSWNYQLPTLYYPSLKAAKKLQFTLFKSENGEAEYGTWLRRCSKLLVEKVAATAKGGILVLTPAYRDIDDLCRQLRKDGYPDVIEHSPRTTLTTAIADFKERSRAGRRPLFVATGGAWTGIDISDNEQPPEADFLLTDLVILRVPIGGAISSVQLARKDFMFDSIIYDAAILLRQGLGRLIRRNGLKDRRIWFLDGRIYFAKVGASAYKRASYSINLYLRREPFEL